MNLAFHTITSRNTGALLFVISTLLIPSLARAWAPGCFKALRVLTSPTDERTSIEVELEKSQGFLMLIESVDGTVGPVLNGKSAPAWLIADANSLGVPVQEFPWNYMGPEERQKIMAIGARGQKFERNRKVPGIKLPDEIKLVFDEKGEFQGFMREGEHILSADKHLGAVEFKGSANIKDADAYELHYSDHRPAGDVAEDALTLVAHSGMLSDPQTSLKNALTQTARHAHVVRKFWELFPKNKSKTLATAQLVDFYRRVETFAHLAWMNEGGTIYINKDRNGEWVHFGPQTSNNMLDLTRKLLNRKVTEVPQFKAEFKIGWVGFRGPQTYDKKGKNSVLGLEFRFIPAPGEMREKFLREIKEILNGVQATFYMDHYGVAKNQIENWLKTSKEPLPARMEKSYYNRELYDLEQSMPSSLREIYSQSSESKRATFQDLAEESLGLKMLIHDWSYDPLLYNKKPQLDRVLKAQEAALKEILKRPKAAAANDIMERFANDSGLMKLFGASVGVYRSK